MDDHDEGRDDVRDADWAWGIFWGAHGLRVSCRVWGHHTREPQGKDARGMDTARPAGPREVVARGHFSHVAWGHAENWWPHSTCPPLSCNSGPNLEVVGELNGQTPCLHRYYESFTNCTEVETNVVGCYWPNPLAESFIAGIHRQFFQNCSVDRQDWEDPPDEILIPLITVPVLLTIAMTGVVVWRSKHTEQVL